LAYYNNEDEKDQNVQGMNTQNNETQQNGAPQQLTGGISGASSGPVPTGAQAQPKATSSGQTGFQNYQKANQGTATNKLAGAANTNVANQAQTAKTGINQATTAFGQKVDAGSLANRENAVNDVKGAVDAARNITAGGAVAQPQQSRFQEVINAKYQGPESLRQSGEYNKAAGKVDTAQTALDQTKNAQGREELLKNMYSHGGNYTQGLNKLDAGILNASQQGVQNLQNTANAAGNIRNQLDQAQIASANLAQNRTNEIQNIQNQARDTFSQGKTAEEQATENRLSSVIQNWNQLPDYFKDIIRNRENGSTVDLNGLESNILGIGSGEGFYNLGADAIKTGVADREKLISKNEQARQAALASLGGLDKQGLLNTNLKYGNADLAGTQTALDALDLTGTRANLNDAEKNFQTFAEGDNITGVGSKKNKTNGKRYYAYENANLGDTLKNAGYQFGDSVAANNIGNSDLLAALARVSSGQASPTSLSGYAGAGEAMGEGLSPGGNGVARDLVDFGGTSSGVNGVLGALGEGTVSDAIVNHSADAVNNDVTLPAQYGLDKVGMGQYSDLLQKYSPTSQLNTLTLGGTGALNKLAGNVINLNNNAIFGGGANTAASKAIAKSGAQIDLQNKVQDALNSQGFGNRANVVDNDKTVSRLSALQQLLANLDKTNT
jgi:hypothetical protein